VNVPRGRPAKVGLVVVHMRVGGQGLVAPGARVALRQAVPFSYTHSVTLVSGRAGTTQTALRRLCVVPPLLPRRRVVCMKVVWLGLRPSPAPGAATSRNVRPFLNHAKVLPVVISGTHRRSTPLALTALTILHSTWCPPSSCSPTLLHSLLSATSRVRHVPQGPTGLQLLRSL
jgi:hypothetical protein